MSETAKIPTPRLPIPTTPVAVAYAEYAQRLEEAIDADRLRRCARELRDWLACLSDMRVQGVIDDVGYKAPELRIDVKNAIEAMEAVAYGAVASLESRAGGGEDGSTIIAGKLRAIQRSYPFRLKDGAGEYRFTDSEAWAVNEVKDLLPTLIEVLAGGGETRPTPESERGCRWCGSPEHSSPTPTEACLPKLEREYGGLVQEVLKGGGEEKGEPKECPRCGGGIEERYNLCAGCYPHFMEGLVKDKDAFTDTLMEAYKRAVAGKPDANGYYDHLVTCNGNRRYPPGTPGHSCSCRAAPAASPPPAVAETGSLGAHHLTPESIQATIKDLREIEAGTETVKFYDRDWRTWCGVLALQMDSLRDERDRASHNDAVALVNAATRPRGWPIGLAMVSGPDPRWEYGGERIKPMEAACLIVTTLQADLALSLSRAEAAEKVVAKAKNYADWCLRGHRDWPKGSLEDELLSALSDAAEKGKG